MLTHVAIQSDCCISYIAASGNGISLSLSADHNMQGCALVQVYPTADIRNLSLRKQATCCIPCKLKTAFAKIFNPAFESSQLFEKRKRLKETY